MIKQLNNLSFQNRIIEKDRSSLELNLVTQHQTDFWSLKKDSNQWEMNLISELESKNECIGSLKDRNIKERLIEDNKT